MIEVQQFELSPLGTHFFVARAKGHLRPVERAGRSVIGPESPPDTVLLSVQLRSGEAQTDNKQQEAERLAPDSDIHFCSPQRVVLSRPRSLFLNAFTSLAGI
jgi:hypothetical protein